MRYLLFAVALTMLVCTAAQAEWTREDRNRALKEELARDEDRPRCELCNMFWDISTTRVNAEFKGVGSHKFESLGCLYQSVDSKSTVTQVKVLDYATSSGKSPKMIDGKKAHYLYDTKRLKGSMAPFIAAFSSKEAATAAKKELGGEYMTYDQVWKKLAATLKDN